MKYLCVCDYGRVRSVGMALLLREQGHEALAIGKVPDLIEKTVYARLLFISWADVIIDLSDDGEGGHGYKIGHHAIRVDIGPDVWKEPRHPDLVKILKKKIKELKL